MSKPFITYTAQVEKLKNEKDLVITDDDFAVESLQNISYYALIGGYKHPFIDIHTRGGCIATGRQAAADCNPEFPYLFFFK